VGRIGAQAVGERWHDDGGRWWRLELSTRAEESARELGREGKLMW
jgi:hypothetical protein